MLDFVNNVAEVLEAFKMYYPTAELSGVTDPYLVYDLRPKLDASGHYDECEVNRWYPRRLRSRSISQSTPLHERDHEVMTLE